MALESNILEQIDFSGGITDADIGSTANKYSECDNLLITPAKKLESRYGSRLDNTTYPLPPIGTVRIGNLINYNSDTALVVRAAKNFYVRGSSGDYEKISSPSLGDAFSNAEGSTVVSVAQWNEQIFACANGVNKPVKLFKDGADWRLLTAGLPALSGTPVFSATEGTASYLYAFAYKYTYTVGSKTYEDWGPTTSIIQSDIFSPDTNAVTITGITHLTNGAGENYDTALVKVVIFRTINGGTTLYQLTELSPGTTSFVDTASDDSIQGNAVLYTTGDVLDNDPPPAGSTIVHINNGVAYWAVGNRVYQSVPGDPDSVPASNYREFDEAVTGISSVNGIPVIMGKLRVWRLDGVIDEIGVGEMIATKISDTAGCVSNASLVQTVGGVVWFGVDGIYTTNGYQVLRINDDQPTRYSALTSTAAQKGRIQGVFDQVGNRVYWATQQDSASVDCDSCLVLDLRWGVSPTSTFTTLSGGASFAPSAITFFNNKFYRGDYRGFVLVHDEAYLDDALIDTTVPASTWDTQPVIFTYRSIHHNFGSSSLRKVVSRIILTCENLSNLSVEVRSINDMNSRSSTLIPIRFRSNIVWGSSGVTWGDDSVPWDFTGIIEEKRRFPAGGLRCNYKQIEITNGAVVIEKSDNLGTASFVGNALVLDSADFTWPTDCVGMAVRFSDDNYTTIYTIKTRSNDTLTFDTPYTLPTGLHKKWEIFGIYKDERINLVGYVLKYSVGTGTQTSFDGNDGGNVK